MLRPKGLQKFLGIQPSEWATWRHGSDFPKVIHLQFAPKDGSAPSDLMMASLSWFHMHIEFTKSSHWSGAPKRSLHGEVCPCFGKTSTPVITQSRNSEGHECFPHKLSNQWIHRRTYVPPPHNQNHSLRCRTWGQLRNYRERGGEGERA